MHDNTPRRPTFLANISVRPKIMALLLGLTLIPLLFSGSVQIQRGVQHGKEIERSRQMQSAHMAASAINRLFKELSSDVQTLARRFPIEQVRREDLNPRRGRLSADLPGWREFNLILDLQPHYNSAFVALPDGRIFSVYPFRPLPHTLRLEEYAWFRDAQARPATTIALSELPPITTSGRPSVIAVTPLFTHQGTKLRAWVGLVTSPLYFYDALKTILDFGIADAMLLSPDERIAAHLDSDTVGHTLPPFLRGSRNKTVHDLRQAGVHLLVARAPVRQDESWSVITLTPADKAFRHVHALVWILVIIVVLTVLFVALFADHLATMFVRPIKELERGAEMIGAGALDYRIEHRGDDEVAHLAQAFNAMGESLLKARKEADRANQDLETANQELDAMVFAISHDLKKKLRGIEAFSTFLEEDYADALDEEGVEMLHSIEQNVDRINQLADDLIRLVEQQREATEMTRFDMQSLLEEVRQRVLQRRRGQILIEPDMPEVMADWDQLLLIFDNLVDNGLKFNRQAEPTVRIRWEDDGLDWIFEVIDNGIGIDARYHEQIFKLFTRLNHEDEYPGSGTGLNLVRRMIHDHRGTVEVHSAAGEGARFVISLPKEAMMLTSPGFNLLESQF